MWVETTLNSEQNCCWYFFIRTCAFLTDDPAASPSPTRRFTPRLLRPLPPPTLRPRTALSQTSVSRWPLSRFPWQQQQPAAEQLLLGGAMPFREATFWEEEEDRVTPVPTPVPLLLPSVYSFWIHFHCVFQKTWILTFWVTNFPRFSGCAITTRGRRGWVYLAVHSTTTTCCTARNTS